MDNLKTTVRLNLEENLNFDKILSYIEIVKSYQHLTNDTYRCEWLDNIEITQEDMDELDAVSENLPAGLKVGNITTYNYKKVPKVI